MSDLINDGAVCRTAPATPGLLNIGIDSDWRPCVFMRKLTSKES